MSEAAVTVVEVQEYNPYEVHHIPLEQIYMDNEFNCRDDLTPQSVLDLANDIRDHELQSPISIQPREDAASYAHIPEQFDYRIIAGHRRFMAFRVLGRKTIPAMIKRGITDEKTALLINLGENLKRKELNLLEEAHAIQKLHQAGIPRETVGKEIGKSGGWVQVRFCLLELPKEIQQEASLGIISQHQVKQIWSLPTAEEQYEAVKAIKQAKERGEKPTRVSKRKAKSIDTKKARQPDELVDMSQLLGDLLGFGLTNRVLAWAAGNITTLELREDVRLERFSGYHGKLLKLKNGEITPEQFAEDVRNDSEIKRRRFVFPDEF